MNVAGGGGGRTGPYWRRQLGMTLPGERTGAQLALINQLRAKQGLPGLGGPVGENTRFITPGQGGPGRQMLPSPLDQRRTAQPGNDLAALRQQLLQQVQQRTAQPSAHPLRPGFEGGPDHIIPPLERPDNGFIGGQYQGHGDLRQTILDRFQGQAPMLTSRDALRRYVANQPGRVARPGVGRQPILPPRQARRATPRPY